MVSMTSSSPLRTADDGLGFLGDEPHPDPVHGKAPPSTGG
ncbi:hypothetical protein SANTM175S_08367 [Streptomyces antimycoticus]